MGKFRITTGDFLKNAGIVGLKYMLDLSPAEKNQDYGISEDDQSIWISTEFALNADWTDMYFKAFVEYYTPFTVYQRVLDKIEVNLEKLDKGVWKPEKEEKEDLKYINDKLLSNSYQSGFANIKEKIKEPEIYQKLKKEKLKEKMGVDELQNRLIELQNFLCQPICRETFVMKSIIYTYINRFWDGKCFLHRSNAKKDMREVFENDFAIPLRTYWSSTHEKAKELCVDCGLPMDSKEKVSIAFMKEMADDLSRKRSAFWNCNVDAYLCPVCALAYALSPLGFQLLANKFIFVNTNESVMALISANSKVSKTGMQAEQQEEEKASTWFARTMNVLLREKTNELSNVQVIVRGTDAEDKYRLNVIYRDVLKILKNDYIQKDLKKLGEHPYVKIKNEFINVHEKVVFSILQYQNLYGILNRLMRETIENDSVIWTAYLVYHIQLHAAIIRRSDKEERKIVMSRISMRDSGYELRKAILYSKGMTSDDCLRGTIYQLLNALSVKNEEKFMEIVIRMYCSSKLLMPDGFVYMLGNKERFQEYGYAFVLGLKGSHPENKKEENRNE